MTKEQERFDACMKAHGWRDMYLTKTPAGRYESEATRDAFEIWKAAQSDVEDAVNEILAITADIRKDLMTTKFGCLQLDEVERRLNILKGAESA
jgi:hypothetical protein